MRLRLNRAAGRGTFARPEEDLVRRVPKRRGLPRPIIDPRRGDVEDDASSPRHRSLLAIAGSMLVELNFLKLALAGIIMIVVPAVLLGLAPLLITGWYGLLSRREAEIVSDLAPVVTLVLAVALAWFGGRPLYRATERSFWSLISLVVQPMYVLFRESLRHIGERIVPAGLSATTRTRLSALATATAGLIVCVLAIWIISLAWPSSRWAGNFFDLRFPQRLIVPTLANSVVIIGIFLAAASLFWSLADATMPPARTLERFDDEPQAEAGESGATGPASKIWRIAHLSDLHAVGGPYEFRLESGRSGPRGNEAVRRALDGLARVHASDPVDLVLMSGDMTDGGRSTEWAAFLDALAAHPDLAARTLVLPGNHDLNVVDRADPARLELPTSTGKTLRQMRMLSAIAAIQGERVLVVDRDTGRYDQTLATALEPYEEAMREFAETGSYGLSVRLGRLWDAIFPMVLPPESPDGLGVILLNSNAETHFSFTNALGLISAEQSRDLVAAAREFPKARFVVALHHHVVEFPKAVRFAARIGTALINASSFVRLMQPLGRRVVVMHGHRHIDWIGASGETRIVSAPSPVMSPPESARFYVHRFGRGPAGTLALHAPQRVEMEEEAQPMEQGDTA